MSLFYLSMRMWLADSMFAILSLLLVVFHMLAISFYTGHDFCPLTSACYFLMQLALHCKEYREKSLQ